jgi:16S rRNA (adenine1518-N6/adenine1519-N6)-dimethyltransferase
MYTPKSQVKPKKFLGQHFLKDEDVAEKIVGSLKKTFAKNEKEKIDVLEIGPGMGILTKYLLKDDDYRLTLVEIDYESIHFLEAHFPEIKDRILQADFLQMDLKSRFEDPFMIIGNFPYNISSQIMFKVIDNRDQVSQVVGMFQKEVAERIASGPGKKSYGILSVLLQAYYDVELLFSVGEEVFSPPPKVKSAVLRCIRKTGHELNCDEKLFKRIVKDAFGQRRKMLRNGLSGFLRHQHEADIPFLDKRAETLSWQDFETLTNAISRIM